MSRNPRNLRPESSSLVSTSFTHSGDDEDSGDPGIISLFLCWNLRNLPTGSSSKTFASFTAWVTIRVPAGLPMSPLLLSILMAHSVPQIPPATFKPGAARLPASRWHPLPWLASLHRRPHPSPHTVVAKRHHDWAFYYVIYNHSWRPSTLENNFLSRNLAEPVADARLCCARAPAHRHVAPRRPGSELFTWRRLRCPKGSCIGKRGEGR